MLLFLYFLILSDQLCEHLPHVDIHPICTDGITMVVVCVEEVSFSIPQDTLPWQPNSLANSTSSPVHTFELSSRAVRCGGGNAAIKGKGSPFSTAEHRVPELIPVLDSQPAGDVSHKPGGRLHITFRQACSYPRNP